MVVFLALGAVALAAGGNDVQVSSQAGGAVAAASEVTVGLAQTGQSVSDDTTALGRPRRGILGERAQECIERQKALMSLVREKMTAADQQTYDRLVSQAEEQREALQKARESLSNTMKELRELTGKYLDVDNTDGTNPSAAGTTIQ